MTSLTQRELWVVREALRQFSISQPDLACTAQRLTARFDAELHERLDAQPAECASVAVSNRRPHTTSR